jgi:hypothetical protein
MPESKNSIGFASGLGWLPRLCLVIDRMHEETGKHGEDRAADGADRRLKQYGADCETAGHLRAQALEYQAANGSAHGADNRIIKERGPRVNCVILAKILPPIAPAAIWMMI